MKTIAFKTPDQNGFFRLPALKEKDNIYDIQLSFYSKGDTLELKKNDYYQPYRYNNSDDETEDDETYAEYEADNAKAYFFTDRSIYRPGKQSISKVSYSQRNGKPKKPNCINIRILSM